MVKSNPINLQRWMTDLPDTLKEESIIHLAIPGSHDSMTFSLTTKNGLAPDAPSSMHKLWGIMKGAFLRWSKTQGANVTKQLQFGIRYFDLRFATKSGSNNLFFTHNIYANEVSSEFRFINDFLDKFPKEVVILDCQHFYEFDYDDHQKLIGILDNAFGSKIYTDGSIQVTLNSLNQDKKQVIIIYRDDYGGGEFWDTYSFPTPWPDTTSPSQLIKILKSNEKDLNSGHVTQAVLTPNSTFIFLRLFSSIRDSCAKTVAKHVFPWIATLLPGEQSDDTRRVNVVIADYVNDNNFYFSKMIINLNYKLLK